MADDNQGECKTCGENAGSKPAAKSMVEVARESWLQDVTVRPYQPTVEALAAASRGEVMPSHVETRSARPAPRDLPTEPLTPAPRAQPRTEVSYLSAPWEQAAYQPPQFESAQPKTRATQPQDPHGAIKADPRANADVEYLSWFPGEGSPWQEFQVVRPLRIPDDLSSGARKDYGDLPEEVKKFLSDPANPWPEGLEKEGDQRAILKFIYELWVTTRRGKVPISKLDLQNPTPAARYNPQEHAGIERKCGFKKKYSIVAFDAMWIPLLPAEQTQCCYREFRGDLPPEVDSKEIHRDSKAVVADINVRRDEERRCAKQREAALSTFESARRQRDWDSTQLTRFVRAAFSAFGLPDWGVEHLIDSDTADFQCQSDGPRCVKKITPITWSVQLDVDRMTPFAGARKVLQNERGKGSWKEVNPTDSTTSITHEYEWEDVCEDYNLWLTIRITLRGTFWLECVEA